jgi:HK97 gp10 family phage protein
MVQGLEDFNRRWLAVPGKVRAAIKSEMERVAAGIVADMRKVVPKGDTGALEASIGWTWGSPPKGSISLGSVRPGGSKSLSITIYAGGGDTFYARFQEFGTLKMPANPFFRPVWAARKRGAKAKITRAINKAIRES